MTAGAPPLVLLDVGSTNSRAWLVRAGQIVESRALPVGVRDSARHGDTSAIRAAVAALIRQLAPAGEPFGVAAAGMITSAQGIAEIPHLAAPASPLDLARGAVLLQDPALAPVPLLLVPGVRTPGGEGGLDADVMRGEETLVVGLVETGTMRPGDVLLNAGSHWKLIALDHQGRVARSRTSLGGEVVHAVQTGTLLTASLPQGPLAEVQPAWLDAGADAAAGDGLLRALFAVRLLDQRGDTTPGQRFAWLAGACISDDVRALVRRGLLPEDARILVSGPGAIPSAWAHLLQREGRTSVVLAPDAVERAFVRGLSHIAHLRARCDAGIIVTEGES